MTKQEFQKKNYKEVIKLLKSIDKQAKLFYKAHKESWAGDLGYVREMLENVNTFLK